MAQYFYLTLLTVFSWCAQTHASIGGYIEPSKKLLDGLSKSFVFKPYDVVSPYYGVKGYKLLKQQLSPQLQKDICAHLKNFKPDSTPEVSFYAISTSILLGCTEKTYTDVTLQKIRAALESPKSTAADLRYSAEILQLLKQNVPNPSKTAQLVQERLKEDDSLQSLGHALHLASHLGSAGKFALDRVEDVVVQADEIDGKMLQWECGLTTTSLLITGLLRLPGAKPFTQVQADKFAEYLLTRKTVQTPRGILALLEAAEALASSDVSPVSISTVSTAQITTDKPELNVHISDILGHSLKSTPAPVVAQSATRITDDVVVMSKQPLSPTSDPTIFSLPLRLEPGQYKIALTAGSHTSALTVRILGTVSLQNLEIGVGDADGSSIPTLLKLQYPSSLKTPLQADANQRLIARFALNRPVQQAFLRLHSDDQNEIIFVAELDNSQLYKIEVNLGTEVSYSGSYKLELILGDSVMSNPILWSLGSIEIKSSVTRTVPPATRSVKPEIKHLFRPAEKRPPQVVSMLFTGLAAAPLLLLLLLWFKLGVNFKNFHIIAVPFHIGLGAILGLFTLFWLKLDMFTTCGWLIPIGGFTFLAGHRLLSHMVKNKK